MRCSHLYLARLVAGFFLACGLVSSSWAGWFGSRSAPDTLTLATWNLDWLMTPETHRELASRCTSQQPASDEHAFPCTPGRPQPPDRSAADFQALSHTADQLQRDWHADVVALQEVDGPAAARQVFRQGWNLDCFVARAHPQKVGFAIRDGIPYRCNGDLSALDIDGSTRAGADMTLYPDSAHPIRLLAVHLKSGCFDGRMDRHFSPCTRLQQQAPVIESWIDARVREGADFAVLGDFNRRLDHDARYPAGNDERAPVNLFQAWSDDEPHGAVLVRATEGQRYTPCDAQDHHKQYIDNILISQSLADKKKGRRFAHLPFAPEDQDRQLSDHCPVVWSLQP
ncbi:MAG: endonuclease/exonuclease/phosphatase family protein [Burkholderiales bacterium]|nr:endonuclease/exonuclease/phosphatase family protein [Burkholderiales bacterium]MDE2432856.1 endonuclease/exonuclease/phosphatase family protein [Burkholderiales bacterium]